MTEPVPGHQRSLAPLVFTTAALLAVLFISFAVWLQQWWMLAFLLLLIPNVVVGVRELRAARKR